MENKAESPDAMQKQALLLILVLSGLTIGGLVWYGPIIQDPAYHDFADQRTLLAIPNFWNVVSNLPFILVGLIGIHRCKARHEDLIPENRPGNQLFFTAILLTGLGSGYYHLRPDNWSLVWDRLAMALSFMAFFSIIIGAYISSSLGRKLLLPLSFFGMFSVMYWIATEQFGAGDLRFYGITQFLSMAVILVIAISWKSEFIRSGDILIIAAGYGLAKLLEFYDAQIHQAVMISGHSHKHLAAAFSAYWMVVVLDRHQQKIANQKKGRKL